MDYGYLYAPLTMQDSQGRRLMWGWAREGRTGEQDVTVYKSMGHVAEDLAAAALVAGRARAAGVGREADLLG